MKGKSIELHQAIILHALPYRDHDKILTLFTKDLGLLKAVVYRKSHRKLSPGATDPLTYIEVMLAEGRGDLFKTGDITILSQNLKLRENLNRLKAACTLTGLLQKSQLPHKPAPLLFELFLSYLKKLPTLENLSVAIDSFSLKLLRHDGCLHIEPNCSACGEPLSFGFIDKGESLCKNHASSKSVEVSFNELKSLHELAHITSFGQLESYFAPDGISQKINEITENCLEK